MRTSLKKLWVDALRSGKYPQATETLKDGIGFCCLGVLCKVLEQHPEERPVALEINEGAAKLEVAWDDGEHESQYQMNELPGHLIDHLGLDEHVDTLMQMNDGRKPMLRHSFPEIAAYIEANVK